MRGGRIAAVGSAKELARLSATRIVELEGRTVLPGFQDAHLHPFAGGMLAIVCNLHETASAADCLGRDRALRGGRTPSANGSPATAGRWTSSRAATLDKERLDAVVPDRPVYLENRDGHTAWVNSRALELAGIASGHAPIPSDGRIERDADGEPSGALHEGAMGSSARSSHRRAQPSRSRRCSTRRLSCTRSASPRGRTRSSSPRRSRPTGPSPAGAADDARGGKPSLGPLPRRGADRRSSRRCGSRDRWAACESAA